MRKYTIAAEVIDFIYRSNKISINKNGFYY